MWGSKEVLEHAEQFPLWGAVNQQNYCHVRMDNWKQLNVAKTRVADGIPREIWALAGMLVAAKMLIPVGKIQRIALNCRWRKQQ